jgi:uncharacterized membrane protein
VSGWNFVPSTIANQKLVDLGAVRAFARGVFTFSSRRIALAGLIAASYAVLTIALAPLSFGVYQVRVAEALTVLPFFFDPAVVGLFVGCAVANYFGGNGPYDIIFGSLLTLLAAMATRYIGVWSRKAGWSGTGMILAPLPPVLFNAFGVSAYLAPLAGIGYWFAVQMIGLGELVSCYVLGLPLLRLLLGRPHLRDRFN